MSRSFAASSSFALVLAVTLAWSSAARANVTNCVLLDECEVEAPAPEAKPVVVKAKTAPVAAAAEVSTLTIIKGNVVSVATFPAVDRVCTAVIEGGSATRYLNSVTHTYFADATSCAAAK